MNSLNNTNILAKSMNGLNVITADEINTNNFNATTLSTTNISTTNLTATGSVSFPNNSINDSALSSNVPLKNTANTFTATNTFQGGITANATQSINFGSNAPTMSGANITNIPTGALSSNVALLDRNPQTFTGANTIQGTLTTTGGITANATQSINFGSNAPTMSGANVSSLNANNISSGTLSDSRLSSNVALKNTSNTFTNTNNFNNGISTCGIDSRQVKIGSGALNADTTLNGDNVAVGYRSLYTLNNAAAIGNSAFGNYAGQNLTNGVNNLFLGSNSGYAVSTGQNNLIVGSSMGDAVGSGSSISNNVAIGSNCIQYVADGCAANLAIGPYALYNDNGSGYGGIYTTAIGPNAGVRTTGSFNCFIGGCYNNSSNFSPPYSSYSNCVCLGIDSQATGSNQIVLGTIYETTYIKGQLNVYGNISATTAQTIDFGTNSPIMGGSNITFNPNIQLVNSNGNIIVGQNNSNGGSNAVLLGNGAGKNLASGADSITAIGTNAMYSLEGNGFENMAIGNSALYYLTYGNYNSCFGKQVGNALTYGCFENTFTGHNCATSNYTKPITYILYTGATTTNTSTLTMSAVPTGLYAGCYVNTYYNGVRYEAPLTSFNPTTFVLSLGNNVNITTSTYIYFYERTLTTAIYTTGVALSGINFTIATGLVINAGDTMAYRSSATLATTIGVVSYNSATGALSVSSNITVVASTTMYFMNTTTPYGSYINNNSIIGSQSLARICTGTSGNTCIGQNVMSANDATNPKYYVGGSNNTAVGINAGSLCYFKSNTNTFIGANADILSSSDNNNISHATAIGADAKVFQSNTVMLGSSSDIVHIPNQINIRTQFLPYSVSTITGTVSLTAPFYGTYIINTATTPITISFPAAISSNMVGMQIWFKRITNANVVNVNLVSGSNIIYTRNASTSTVGSALNSLLPATQYAASMICLSTTSWAIIV